MLILRRAKDRGHADHGWLDTWHSLSFADYHDPAWMEYGGLRVLNEDIIQPGGGFGMHPHRDMEIVTWVLSGALRHADSLGNGSVIRPGDAQRMSAGRGILHSEANASDAEPVHLLQIWLTPRSRSLDTGYEQVSLPAVPDGGWRQLASPEGGAGVSIQADARILVAELFPGQELRRRIGAERRAWVQVAAGGMLLNGQSMTRGDGAAVAQEEELVLEGHAAWTQALVFELA